VRRADGGLYVGLALRRLVLLARVQLHQGDGSLLAVPSGPSGGSGVGCGVGCRSQAGRHGALGRAVSGRAGHR
jgi:hypothetical protein